MPTGDKQKPRAGERQPTPAECRRVAPPGPRFPDLGFGSARGSLQESPLGRWDGGRSHCRSGALAPPLAGGPASSPAFWKVQHHPPARAVALETRVPWVRRRGTPGLRGLLGVGGGAALVPGSGGSCGPGRPALTWDLLSPWLTLPPRCHPLSFLRGFEMCQLPGKKINPQRFGSRPASSAVGMRWRALGLFQPPPPHSLSLARRGLLGGGCGPCVRLQVGLPGPPRPAGGLSCC